MDKLPTELWTWIYAFCTAKELRATRLVSTTWKQRIPLEWTVDRVFISENGTPTPVQFLDTQFQFRFVETILGMHFQNRTALDFAPALTRVRDVHLMYLTKVERISFPHEMSTLHDLMITCAFPVRQLNLPNTWTQLRSLFLSGMELPSFEFHPAWTQLRTISLLNIGIIPLLVVPATYAQLLFLHVERLQLTRLRIQLKPQTLMVRIQESHQVVIESHAPPNESPSFLLYDRVPVLWEPLDSLNVGKA